MKRLGQSLLVALVLCSAGAVGADEWRVQLLPENLPDHLMTSVGTALQIGGGVSDFVQEEVGGVSDIAGAWNVRAIVGTRSFVSGEVGYVGGAQSMDALGLHGRASLLRSGLEANLRLNVPITNGPWMIEPYAFGGVGWSRYDLLYEGSNTSSIRDNDDVFNVPVGGGFSIAYKQFTLDARYAFYPTFDDELLETPTGSTDTSAGLDNWTAALMFGVEL